MFEVTLSNVKDYLLERGWISSADGVAVEELGGGISNTVLKIVTPNGAWVLKQAYPKLRTHDEWLADLDRIFVERDAIIVVGELLGEHRVPKVLFSDEENYLFIMTCAPQGHYVWKSQLLKGEVDLTIAAQAGEILAHIHNLSHENQKIMRRFSSDKFFIQLRVDPYHWTTAKRHPDVAAIINEEVERMLSVKLALVDGDYSPKNLLVCPPSPAHPLTCSPAHLLIVDWEVAHYGDPCFDIAFCLNHLFLKSVKNRHIKEHYFEAARRLWDAYFGTLTLPDKPSIMQSTIRELGCLMLARIDGKSKIEYLTDEESKDLVRGISKTVLLEGFTTLEHVIRLMSKLTADLR